MNFSQVNDAVRAFLNNPEAEAYFPRFFEMAEAEMNRRLDCQAMDDVANISILNGEAEVPCGFAGVKSFTIPGSPNQKLEYVRSDAMDNWGAGWSGGPWYYTVLGGKFLFSFSSSTLTTAKLRYRKRLDPLAASNICNWVSDRYPDAYIYGVLKHAGIFLGDERLPLWAGAFDNALDAANLDASGHDYGSTMQLQNSVTV